MSTVFMSHSSLDKLVARRLAVDLGTRGVKVWLDEWEIKPGDSIVERIGQAIVAADALILLLSPASVESHWVRVELDVALFRQLERRRIAVIPVLIEACEVPPLLSDRKYVDFRGNYEQGLCELLWALGGPCPNVPLSWIERRLLGRLQKDGTVTVTSSGDPSQRPSDDEEALWHLERLGLVVTRQGKTWGHDRDKIWLTHFRLTETGVERLKVGGADQGPLHDLPPTG